MTWHARGSASIKKRQALKIKVIHENQGNKPAIRPSRYEHKIA